MNIKKKLFKKKLFTLLLSAFMFSTSLVYANTDTNLLNILKEGLTSFKNYYITFYNGEMDKYETTQKNNISNFVKTTKANVDSELGKYTNETLKKDKEEVNKYVEELKTTTDNIVKEEINNAKQEIDNNSKEKVEKIKNNLYQHLLDNLKDNFKK